MKGYISTEFTMWCGRCDAWWQTGEHKGKHDFAKFMKEKGWVLDREFGWLCPKCKDEVRKVWG